MTVWEIVKLTGKDVNQFAIHCGNFLDEFYRSSNEKRQRMVEREPEALPNLPDYMLPFLAGMVHKLCNDYGVDCPDWIHKASFFLKEPHFWLNAQGNLRLVLLAESPIEFKIRNLFMTSDTLTRV